MITIFDKIVKNKMPSFKIFENEQVIAILDIFPKNNGHFLVIPKKKSKNLYDIDDLTLVSLILIARKLAIKITKKLNINSFMLHINNGKNSMQEVLYTHIHIIPEKRMIKIFLLKKCKNYYMWKI